MLNQQGTLEDVARSHALDLCIDPCIGQGRSMLSEATVKVAVAAVVAAVFLDNAENLDAARSVMRTLG